MNDLAHAKAQRDAALAAQQEDQLQDGPPAWFDESGPPTGTAPEGPRPIPFEWATSIDDDASGDVPEIVEGFLTAGGMTVAYGDSHSGKSYLFAHLGLCIASGLPWLGQRTVPGAVIYVAAEGAGSIRQRLRAYRKHFGGLPVRFGLVKTSINMMSPNADLEALVALIRAKGAEIVQPVSLVIIDTLARSMPGGNENDGIDMGKVVAGGDRVRQETGAHVLWVHHCGKDAAKGARGWSGLRAATDTEIEVTKDEVQRLHFAEITKQRDLGTLGLRVCGRLLPVELGKNQWGNPIEACVVQDVEGPTPPRRDTKKQPKGTETAMEALRELSADSRRLSTQTTVTPGGKRLVSVEKWQERFYARRGTSSDESASTRRSEWSRAKKALIDSRRVGVWEGDAWIW